MRPSIQHGHLAFHWLLFYNEPIINIQEDFL